jgi:1-acyl-sn-glycerol-3-phosphate acyltransferase
MRLAYGVFAWLAFTLITLLTLGLLILIPGEHNRRGVVKSSARLIFRLIGVRPRVKGLEHLPNQPCVVAANHASYLDGVILTAVLPPIFSYVIKREMTRIPGAHYLLRRIGSEFVDRANSHRGARDMRRILEQAERNESMAFFPEGTFTANPGLRRFHNGAFATAIKSKKPLVPVVIRGSRDMLPANKWLPRRSSIEVVIKAPIQNPGPDGSLTGLMDSCRHSILEDLDEPDLTA